MWHRAACRTSACVCVGDIGAGSDNVFPNCGWVAGLFCIAHRLCAARSASCVPQHACDNMHSQPHVVIHSAPLAEQLHFKEQVSIWRDDASSAALAIRKVCACSSSSSSAGVHVVADRGCS